MFEVLIAVASFIAGAIASVVGFGSGSILTPLLSLQIGTRLAVAAISIPHLVATFVRFWLLRKDVDRRGVINLGDPQRGWRADRGFAAFDSFQSRPDTRFRALPSAVTSNPAIRGHFKTGQWRDSGTASF